MTMIRELNAYTEPGVYALMVDGAPRVMLLPLADATYMVSLDSHGTHAPFTAEVMPPATIANGMWLGDLHFKIAHQDRVPNTYGAVIANKRRVGLKCRMAGGRTKMLWFPTDPTMPLKKSPAKSAAMPWKLMRINADGSTSTLFEPDLVPDADPPVRTGEATVH